MNKLTICKKCKTINCCKTYILDTMPDSFEKEDLSSSPIENMIFDFSSNIDYTVYTDYIHYTNNSVLSDIQNLPQKGNVFPIIKKHVFSKIQEPNTK